MNNRDFVEELLRRELAGEMVTISVSPVAGFELISALQLVLRHPHLPADQQARIRAMTDHMISSWFPAGPAHKLLQQGYDPDFDVDRSGESEIL